MDLISKLLKTLGLFTLMPLLTPIQADAISLMAEPTLSYDIASFSSNGESMGSGRGLGFGARFGFIQGDSFFGGLDFHYSMLDAEINDQEGARNFNNTLLGIALGMKIPGSSLRTWAGYYFYDQGVVPVDLILGNEVIPINVKFKGNSFKAGLGYSLVRNLSINTEYAYHTYSRIEFGGNENELVSPLKNSVFQLSLSTPLSWVID